MGKKAVHVKDSCGFISNRVLMLTVNEAAFLVHEGVADAASVDEVFRGCFGHPMGPLETADLIGVDTDPLQRRSALRALRRQQVPPLPAAEADDGRRAARPQDRPRFLHLRLELKTN